MLKREKSNIWKNERKNMEGKRMKKKTWRMKKRTSVARFFSRESIMNLFRYRKRRKNVMYYKI